MIACGISDHDLAFVNRSMRISKIKKDPETINIRKHKSFDSIAFLEELKSKKVDAINNTKQDVGNMEILLSVRPK